MGHNAVDAMRIMLMQAEPGAHAQREQELLPRLHPEEQARYRSFSGTRRVSWLAGRALLLAALAETRGEAQAGSLRTAANGGVSYAPDLHLNLSHSGSWFAAVLAAQPVGVDIEALRPRTVVSQAARLFSAAEARWLRAQTADAQLAGFYGLWTLKEAACKAAGLSIWDSLRHACFDLEARRARLEPPLPPGPWHFLLTEFTPGWRLAAALRGATYPACSCHCLEPGGWRPWPLSNTLALRT